MNLSPLLPSCAQAAVFLVPVVAAVNPCASSALQKGINVDIIKI